MVNGYVNIKGLKMFNLKFKKILLSFLAITIASYSVVTPFAYAQSRSGEGQGRWWFPKYNEFLNKVNQPAPNEIFGERYTHAQVSWIILSLLNIIVGPIASCAEEQDFGGCIERTLSQGQDPGMTMPLAMMTGGLLSTKPVSSVDYIAEKMDRLGIVNTTYAQDASQAGFGFANSLSLIQGFWRMSRDAAYSLVIFMILILGFMIMFRAQLSPRTVITVQSALPRVIIGLLLITFSYAIAGLLVDLTFVAQGIVAGIISSSGLTNSLNPVDAFNSLNDVAGSVGSLFLAFTFGIFAIVFNTATSPFAVLTGGSGLIVGLGMIMIVLVAVVAIIALMKIFWVMVRTYVVIIMLTAISPFIFLYGIIKDGINGMWFKQMVANLSVFFTVGAMLLMCNVLLFSSMQPGFVTNLVTGIDNLFGGSFFNINPYNITPGVVTGDQAILPGFTGFGAPDVIGVVVAFGLFMSIPKFASSVRDWIATGQAPRGGFDAGGGFAAIGGAAGAAAGIAGAPGKALREARSAENIKQVAAGKTGVSLNKRDILVGELSRRLRL